MFLPGSVNALSDMRALGEQQDCAILMYLMFIVLVSNKIAEVLVRGLEQGCHSEPNFIRDGLRKKHF